MGQDNTAFAGEQWRNGAALSTNPIALGDYVFHQEFIDEYLKMRLYDLTDDNREIVADAIDRYEGGELVLPSDLVAHLDQLFRIHNF